MGDTYEQGTGVRESFTFHNSAGTPTDPDGGVWFAFLRPDGKGGWTETVYEHGVDNELVRDDTGAYHVDLTLDAAGEWERFWVGAGSIQHSDRDTFTVTANKFKQLWEKAA